MPRRHQTWYNRQLRIFRVFEDAAIEEKVPIPFHIYLGTGLA